MGIIGLGIICLFYFLLIRNYLVFNKSLSILILLIPAFFNSFFDANMEGVQYPFLLFSFLGYAFLDNQSKEKTQV